MRAFLTLSKTMTLGLLRDRMTIFFTLIFPLMFLVLFGALFKDTSAPQVKVVQVGEVAVFDELPERQRERMRDVLVIEKTDGSRAALSDALAEVREGEVDGVVYLPRTAGEEGKTSQSPTQEIELRVSAADRTKSATVTSVVDSVLRQANQRATGQPPAFALATGQVEDESLKEIQYLTPGLLGWAIAMGAVFGTAYNLVSWRKKRILRRLWLAPVGAISVVSARVGVNLVLALAQTAIFVGIAALPYYGLQLTGDWWLSVPLVLAGSLAFMSIGLVVGAWAKSEEAANGMAQLIVLPMAFLSGAFFPLDVVPAWVRSVSEFLPLKHLADALQGVLTQGESWGTALPVIGGLLLFAALLTLLAKQLFRWDDA